MEKDQKSAQRVAIYIRVSTEEQVEKYGRELQESAIKALIESRKHSDSRLEFAGDQYLYIDEGISGRTESSERPAFARLREDIVNSLPENRPFDIVAVYKIDRFARRLKVLLNVIDFFEENSVKFLSVNESIDTSTPFGRAMLSIIGVIAELEIETTKERTQSGRKEAVKKGVLMGNTSIYGYIKDKEKRPVIFEPEAKIVQLIFDLLVSEKLSVGQITNQLKEMKVLSPQSSALHYEKRKGKSTRINNDFHWSPNAVRKILVNPIYKGEYYFNKTKNSKILPKEKWELSPYLVPQIIDTVQFEKAQRLIEQNKHQQVTTSTNHTYLLSGLLVCDTCFNPIKDSISGRKHWVGSRKELEKGNHSYYYVCARKNRTKYDTETLCHTLPLPAEEIEKYVVNFAQKLIQNPVATFEYQNKLKSTQKAFEHLKRQEKQYLDLIESVPVRIRNLRDQQTHGYIDMPQLKKEVDQTNQELKKYQDMIRQIRKNISENTMSNGYVESLKLFSKKYANALSDISKDRKEIYHIVHTLIEEIVVYSRPVTEKDTIAGKKKDRQEMPYRLHIKLKLPQDILQDLIGSGYKNASGVSIVPSPNLFPKQSEVMNVARSENVVM